MGESILAADLTFFNPDVYARQLRESNPNLSFFESNSLAWNWGRDSLETAISTRQQWAFETTLGGDTITAMLRAAALMGIPLTIWYVGLETAELHINRVAARVAKGGHPIPSNDIYKRFINGPLNLISLMPHISVLKVFDNSADTPPETAERVSPKLLLEVSNGIVNAPAIRKCPSWAKPIIAAARLQFSAP